MLRRGLSGSTKHFWKHQQADSHSIPLLTPLLTALTWQPPRTTQFRLFWIVIASPFHVSDVSLAM